MIYCNNIYMLIKLFSSSFYVLIIIVWSFRLGKADDDRVADQTVHFVILDLRLMSLLVGDLHQVPGLVVGKLRPVVDTCRFIDMGLHD